MLITPCVQEGVIAHLKLRAVEPILLQWLCLFLAWHDHHGLPRP